MADSTVTPSSTKKPRGRGVTMMRKLTKVCHTGIKIKNQFNLIKPLGIVLVPMQKRSGVM
jgi:hypothetical protein